MARLHIQTREELLAHPNPVMQKLGRDGFLPAQVLATGELVRVTSVRFYNAGESYRTTTVAGERPRWFDGRDLRMLSQFETQSIIANILGRVMVMEMEKYASARFDDELVFSNPRKASEARAAADRMALPLKRRYQEMFRADQPAAV